METEVITLIPVEKLHLSPTNPRKRYSPAELQELAASIQKHDLLQPIIVRPHQTEKGDFEVIAGNRRTKAIKTHLDEGWLVACQVREMDDEQVINIQIDENAQREDLTPMEEAEVFNNLITQGKVTVQQLAERFSKTPAYIHTRANLVNLCDRAKQLFDEKKMGVKTAILLARLDPEAQEDTIRQYLHHTSEDKEYMSPYNAIKRHVDQTYYLNINEAPFDTQAKYGKKPKCAQCPSNTACNVSLFPDLTGGRCTDADCWQFKEEQFFKKQKTAYLKQIKKLGQEPVYAYPYWYLYDTDQEHLCKRLQIDTIETKDPDFHKRNEGDEDAALALFVGTNDDWKFGQTGWVRHYFSDQNDTGEGYQESPEEKAEREQREEKHKNFRILETVKEDALYEAIPKDMAVFPGEIEYWLSAAMGCHLARQKVDEYIPNCWHGFRCESLDEKAKADYQQTKGEVELNTYLDNYAGVQIQSLEDLSAALNWDEETELTRYMIKHMPIEYHTKALRIAMIANRDIDRAEFYKENNEQRAAATYNIDIDAAARNYAKQKGWDESIYFAPDDEEE